VHEVDQAPIESNLSGFRFQEMRVTERITAKKLNELWGVGAEHALYIHDGHWYHKLDKFPGALFDKHGYILFKTDEEYIKCPYLNIAKGSNQVNIRSPLQEISKIPGYVRVVGFGGTDIDIPDAIGIEGESRLRIHLSKERDRDLIKKKKQGALNLDCEICGFSFARTYGNGAGEYCEAHHLFLIGDLTEATETKLSDLAILCANCHRVVHRRYPPYSRDEVRNMLKNCVQPLSQ
jgi:5-methylcytosine-specific restriction endonuclease McrA